MHLLVEQFVNFLGMMIVRGFLKERGKAYLIMTPISRL